MVLENIILVFLVLIVMAVLIILANSSLGGLDFSTGRLVSNDIIQILAERKLASGEFYDLGSSRGGLAIKLAKALPKMVIKGIDDSWLRVTLAKSRAVFLKNVSFGKGDLFNADLSGADIVYIYLPQEVLPSLQAKLHSQLKPHSLVITHKVQFPNWKPVQIFHQLFMYEI